MCAGLAGAAPPAPERADKSGFTFFNPTPDALLRELATDRPDATESPLTVDAGRVQVEMDFANRTRNRLDGVRTTGWAVAPFNLRLGLTPCFELGVFVAPWQRETERPRVGPKEKRAGFGDTTVRGKLNLGGNDGGPLAWGLMADLKRPTAAGGVSNGTCEGALPLPVASELGGGWEGEAIAVPIRRADGYPIEREAVDGASAEAEEDRPSMSSGEGEARNDVPTEGCRVRGEVESERVAHIGNGGGTGGSLNLRQDISGLGSWGFNGQTHRQILARCRGKGGTPGGQIHLAEPRRCGDPRGSPALPDRLPIDLVNVRGEVDRPNARNRTPNGIGVHA